MLLGLFACTGHGADSAAAEDDSSAASEEPVYDRDNDGWTSDVDCDDMDREISPGAEERCDGADNDCDGETDESDALDEEDAWPDADGDGYGAGDAAEVCPGTEGYADNADDCDDGDASVNPAGEETDCDGADHDCDGRAGTEDGDGDGYAACEECDDADEAVSPAAVEACDAIDNDCNGETDEGTTDCICAGIETFEDHRYWFCTDFVASFDEAEGFCEYYGMTLVVVGSAEEDAWLEDGVDTWWSDPLQEWFMGFTDREDEGTWVWVDGSEVTYTGWADGEPNESGYGEDCAYYNWNAGTRSGWNDEPCESAHEPKAFVCESP